MGFFNAFRPSIWSEPSVYAGHIVGQSLYQALVEPIVVEAGWRIREEH